MIRMVWTLIGTLIGVFAVACTPADSKKSENQSQGRSAQGKSPQKKHSPMELSKDSSTPNSPDLNSKNRKAGKIRLKDVASYPSPGSAVPSSIRFSPDDKFISYLHSNQGTLDQQLWLYDIDNKKTLQAIVAPGGGIREEKLSLEESLERERQRTRNVGITHYDWAEKQNRILLPILGKIYRRDLDDNDLQIISDPGNKPALQPHFSRDGESVAYVWDDELYVVAAKGHSSPKQISKDARGTGKSHGLAEYIAQEEMGRTEGFWWSYDNKHLAYTEVDETHIPLYRIVHQGKSEIGENSQEDHHYPFAGQANAKVRLGIVSARGGKTTWVNLEKFFGDDFYLARVDWFPNGTLSAQVLSRDQSQLQLVKIDPKNGSCKTWLREKSDVWINLHDMLLPLEQPYKGKKDCFIWASERSGFRHLYLYDYEGQEIQSLTLGKSDKGDQWQVDKLLDVDESQGKLWFLAAIDNPTEMHLFEVGLDGSGFRQISQEAGTHEIVIDHQHKRYIDRFSSLNTPPQVFLRDLNTGEKLDTIYQERDPRIDQLGLSPPRIVSIDTDDGDRLYGTIYQPDVDKFGPGPYPTMLSVYGGPHVQKVVNGWKAVAHLREQFLRERGILVFTLDNRGSSRRGLAFEGKIRHDMGNIEVQDQVQGVKWLVQEKLTDPNHVGIFGWSYGGYLSAMALARAPQTFKIAIAGAPVTDWDGYDTNYTERYMGTPQSNPKGYQQASVMTHVPNITGKLMIVHGMIDENVHFRHSARLINALISEQKDYEIQLFPDERHMPRKLEDRMYLEDRVFKFIAKNL